MNTMRLAPATTAVFILLLEFYKVSVRGGRGDYGR